MRPFWEVAIRPLLAAVRPRIVVEIGALQGSTTNALLEQLGPDAELHVIDPLPAFDPEEHARKFPGRYVFHRDLSLNVLPSLPAADVAFIDGDHNWYTVHHELELLAATAREAGKPLPVFLMHDVCWPYGRRDLYYDPATIPEEFRQPHVQKGMTKGVAEVAERGGLNPRNENAVLEGGPRNGVATALDDFLARYDRPVRKVILPFRFGLAIVVEEARLEAEPELATLLDELEPTGRQLDLLRRSEDLTLDTMSAYHSLAFAPKPNLEANVVRYLELLKAALLDEHYVENELRNQYLLSCARTGTTPNVERLRDPARWMAAELRRLLASRRVGRIAGDGNGVFPYFPYTTMGRVRLEHLERCLDAVRTEQVPGALVEVGTGRGGGAIFMRGYLEARGMRVRHVWVADAFLATAAEATTEPEPATALPPSGFHAMRADLNQVRDGFARFGLLDGRVHFLHGPPTDTLPGATFARVGLLRIADTLDGSPRDVLELLYDRLSIGGFVIVEDSSRNPARAAAIEAFRTARGIEEQLDRVDAVTVAWRKAAERPGARGARAPAARPLRRPPLVRPAPATGRKALSVVVVFYNMRREAERTLHSLSRAYQEGIDELDYEVIAVENGSAPDQVLGASFVEGFGPEFRYLDLGAAATPSPARALNRGIAAARGEAIAVMIDGAHVLTPGVLRFGMTGLRTYEPAIVATQQWYVGPGQQHDTVHEGYDTAHEDRLFWRIGWPSRGYALFTIGHFIGDRDWFDALWESNCLFVPRAVMEGSGALDESFETPGGSFANLELYERLGSAPGVTLVTILGEASFHQVHGGTTTNTADHAKRRRMLAGYHQEYAALRGKAFRGPAKHQHFVGHLRIGTARTRARRRMGPGLVVQSVMADHPDGFPQRPEMIPDDVALEFTEAYWRSLAWRETPWLGHAVPKSPADLIAYQELIVRLRPDWIVETRAGGATLAPFLASICDLAGGGRVLTIGAEAPEAASVAGERVTSITADPADSEAAARVLDTVGEGGASLVVLGSRRAGAVMLEEFAAYSPLVPVGGYVVVEDTIVGRTVWPAFGPGPAHAVTMVLTNRDDFQLDRSPERHGATFNPKGYLRRVAG